jgi:parallel beta-helix repeat protein
MYMGYAGNVNKLVDNPKVKPSFLTPHETIYIVGNADFAEQAASEGWDGSGASNDPYVIEQYDILVESNNSVGIGVKNTDVHFIVRNCRVTVTGLDTAGIYLVSTNNALITNNTVTNSQGHGVHITNSTRIQLIGNTVKDCPDHCAVHLIESPNNMVVNNTLINSLRGLSLYANSNNITVSGNDVVNSSQYGIYLFNRADYNLISDNNIVNNEIGIRFYYTMNNTVTRNLVTGNGEGMNITVNSYFSRIYLNSFIDNGGAQVSSDNITNIFSNGTIGNFWSDYNGTDLDKNGLGDTPHPVAGEAGSKDYHPLTIPEYTGPDLNNPGDISYAEGSLGNNITWVAGDENPWVYKVSDNGSDYINETHWTNGTISVNVDGLTSGTHRHEITIHDRYGNFKTDTVIVEVTESLKGTSGFTIVTMISIITFAGISSVVARKRLK